jgi:hypothetical protein
MIQSFFVYGLFGLLMFLLGTYSSRRQLVYNQLGKYTSFWVWDVLLALLLFAFISGIRWNVGVDHLVYLENYLKQQNFGHFVLDKEVGFEFITRLFTGSGFHFSFYFGFLAFLQIFFVYWAFKNERYLYPFIAIVIIFGPHYLSWMNGIRQMIVATVFIYSIKFILERKIIKYFLTILLASLMHHSALILLIFYFIPQRDYFKNRILTFILVGASLVLGSMNFWIDNLKVASDLLSFLGYDWYSENIELLIENGKISNIGPRRLSTILISLAAIWYSSKLKVKFKNTYFLTYYNIAIFGFLLYNLLANTHHGFLRPVSYLTIFSIPTTAYLLVYLKNHFAKKSIVFIAVFIIAISYLPMSIIADNGKGREDFTNYKFYWYHINS